MWCGVAKGKSYKVQAPLFGTRVNAFKLLLVTFNISTTEQHFARVFAPTITIIDQLI